MSVVTELGARGACQLVRVLLARNFQSHQVSLYKPSDSTNLENNEMCSLLSRDFVSRNRISFI